MKRLFASAAIAVLCATVATPSWAATDTYLSSQWGLSKIRAAQAWPVSKGAGVTIAIIDTGIDLDHPDLKSKIVGAVSCIGGTCAAGGNDDNGHGTHVAGIAAAITSNGRGIAGVAPSAKLMPVKVLEADGSGDCGDIAVGIRYAADHGARVINLSLGPELPGLLGSLLQGGCIADLEDAAEYAWNKGRFVAIAAGNDGLNSVYDSASLTVVGATGPGDQAASYSNSGADIYAPGGDAVSCSAATCIISTWRGGGYRVAEGTSMATPHVSGIAALLFARGYSNAGIKARLSATADNRNGLLRVNAARAVGAVSTTPKPTPKSSSPAASSRPRSTGGSETTAPTVRPSMLPMRISPPSTSPSARPTASETPFAAAAIAGDRESFTRQLVISVAAIAVGIAGLAAVWIRRRRRA